ncbi:10582_t:CDS:1, partial [Gigaspora margarita]
MTSFDKSLWKRFITNIRAIIVSILSYVIDFSNLPKEIKDAFNKQVLIAMAALPIKFHRDMDSTSDKYLVYLYEYQQA